MNFPERLQFAPLVLAARHGRVRRGVDLALGCAALLTTAPLMLLIALAIWSEGGRPIFFVQKRLGAGGSPFSMYKFRKFHTTYDSKTGPLTLRDDCRLTRIGAVLAFTKLDELPQLLNVLKGEMALVGPRPESLAFADCFINGLEDVLRYRPGLFGPSQVLFRHENRLFPPGEDPVGFYRKVLFAAKAKADLSYFSRRTIAADFGWIARGVLAVCGGTPAIPIALAEREDVRAGYGDKTIGDAMAASTQGGALRDEL